MIDNSGFREHRVRVNDGHQLNVREYGELDSGYTTAVCLPGLSRTARDFHPLAIHLSQHKHRPRRVIVIESRGRGKSDHDKNWENYTPLTEAQDVLDILIALEVEPALIVGTSRGGILAMIMAAIRPGVMSGVVLNDIGAEIDMRGLARIKNYLTPTSKVRDWNDAIQTLQNSQGTHFPDFSLDDWETFARMTFANGDKGPERDYDKKLLKTLESIDFQSPLPPMWAQFAAMRHVPVLVLRGELSDILAAETVAKMHKLHPAMEDFVVSGQGHAPLLDGPQLLSKISAFATSIDDARPSFG